MAANNRVGKPGAQHPLRHMPQHLGLRVRVLVDVQVDSNAPLPRNREEAGDLPV